MLARDGKVLLLKNEREMEAADGRISHEEVGLFAENDVPGLNMPEVCKRSIATWFERLRADAVS